MGEGRSLEGHVAVETKSGIVLTEWVSSVHWVLVA
jgi:hypothetical protein